MRTFNVIFHTFNGGMEAIDGIKAESESEAIGIARKRANGQGLRFSSIVETYNCKTCGAYPPSQNCGECPKYLAGGEER